MKKRWLLIAICAVAIAGTTGAVAAVAASGTSPPTSPTLAQALAQCRPENPSAHVVSQGTPIASEAHGDARIIVWAAGQAFEACRYQPGVSSRTGGFIPNQHPNRLVVVETVDGAGKGIWLVARSGSEVSRVLFVTSEGAFVAQHLPGNYWLAYGTIGVTAGRIEAAHRSFSPLAVGAVVGFNAYRAPILSHVAVICPGTIDGIATFSRC